MTAVFQGGTGAQGVRGIPLPYLHGGKERKLFLNVLLQHGVTEGLRDPRVLLAVHLASDLSAVICLGDQSGSSTGESTLLSVWDTEGTQQ